MFCTGKYKHEFVNVDRACEVYKSEGVFVFSSAELEKHLLYVLLTSRSNNNLSQKKQIHSFFVLVIPNFPFKVYNQRQQCNDFISILKKISEF